MEKCRKNQPGQQKCIKQPEEQKYFLIQAVMERKKIYVEVGTDQSEDEAYCPSAYLYLGKQHFSTDIGLFLSFLMGRKQSRTSLLEPVCCKKR